MNIVFINTVCNTGSTGRITVELYRLAEKNGYSPCIAYGRNNAPANICGYKIGNRLDFLSHVAFNFITGKNAFASKTVTRKMLCWLDNVKPCIIHLHNIHGFYINVEILFKYIKKNNIKIVWTLHDCWPFTGHCAHFAYAGCDKWKSLCECCHIHSTAYPYSIFRDNSKNNFIRKRKAFLDVENITLVTPSQWLANLTRESFLSNYSVRVIPNGIDLDIFKPCFSSKTQNSFKIILGVANVWTKSKGLEAFIRLAEMIDDSYRITLVGLTRTQQMKLKKKYGNKITPLCRTQNVEELVELYGNAYVFVNPTMEDTFPTTNLEALACGTPVITYRTGGSPESVDETCGIVVEQGNVAGLYEAILSLEENQNITSENCRKRALNYDKDKCFEKYLELYQSIK